MVEYPGIEPQYWLYLGYDILFYRREANGLHKWTGFLAGFLVPLLILLGGVAGAEVREIEKAQRFKFNIIYQCTVQDMIQPAPRNTPFMSSLQHKVI